ncbi:uncharacterized protein [Apostichopus japonicus]|uniref:uncharacterized protein n=1 Tax=Stichopus japonicus TaxID=307972 RepID=UPI003AB1BB86
MAKKRGRYKRYLDLDNSECEIPRNTKKRWLLKHQGVIGEDSCNGMARLNHFETVADNYTTLTVGDSSSSSEDEDDLQLQQDVFRASTDADLEIRRSEELEDAQLMENEPTPSSSSENSSDDDTSSVEAEQQDKPLDGDEHNLQSPIFHGSLLSHAHLLLLVMAFVLKHQLTGTCLEDLLSLLNLMVPGSIVLSKYLFQKQFLKCANNIQKHFFCNCCLVYLGENPDIDSCPDCSTSFNLKKSEKKGNYFLYVPIEDQLKTLLARDGISEAIGKGSTSEGVYNDIYSGSMYKEMFSDSHHSSINLSILWNCDGVPLFKSSKTSIWTIQVIINELPKHIRAKHILLCGIWIGNDKPRMDMFLRPFVEELRKLGTDGIVWKNKHGRVYSAVSSCDAVARCALQNIHQFNGSHGCGLCLHEGVSVNRGHGVTRVYPVEGRVERRTKEGTLQNAKEAVETGKIVKGVKGPSILCLLPRFNAIDGCVPDYMHSVILGVVRQFGKLWFDTSYHHGPFYLGRHVQEISSRLLKIKPPCEASRLPRSLLDRKFWKATEWKNFLLYSPVILCGLLPARFLTHWWLLVYAIYSLGSSTVTTKMIQDSKCALLKFVIQMQDLYGLEHISYNVHQLTHLSQYVLNWGPLWASSAFAFEDNNQRIKSFFKGTKGIAKQIMKNSLIFNKLDSLATVHLSSATEETQKLYSSFSQRGCKYIEKAYLVADECTGLGTPIVRYLTDMEKAALIEIIPLAYLHSHVKCFKRFVLNKRLFHSQSYSSKVKQNDSVVSLRKGNFASIQSLIAIHDHSSDIAHSFFSVIIGHDLQMSSFSKFDTDVKDNLAKYYKKGMYSELIAFYPYEVKSKCLEIPFENYSFVLEWPGHEFTD